MDYAEAFWTPILTLVGTLLALGSVALGPYLMYKSGKSRPETDESGHIRPHWVWMLPFPVYELRVFEPEMQDPDDFFDNYPDDM